MLAAAGYLLSDLASCSPAAMKTLQTDVNNNIVSVPISSINSSGLQIIHPKGSYYNIAVQKKSDNTYEALLLQCTHQENQLTVTANGFTCSLHGSQFDKDGNVTHGPAAEPLQRYKTNIDKGNLLIYINS